VAEKKDKCDILADEVVSILSTLYKCKPVKVNSYVNNALKNIWIRELNNNKFSEYSDNINEDDDEVYDEQNIDNQNKYQQVMIELEKIDWFNRTILSM
jgi:hypothetical protein